MKFSQIILLIICLCGTFYNVDNTLIRLLLMCIWAFLPLVLISLIYHKRKVNRHIISVLFFSLFVVFVLMLSFTINVNTLTFEFDGPNVEKLTPFLFASHFFLLLFYYQISELKISQRFLDNFMLWLFIILFIDMLVRYIQAPNYFLNYYTRHQAKTIGFFSTTNVNGQIIAFFLTISWFIKFKRKKMIQWGLFIILITTMARSAIVTVLAVYALFYLSTTKTFFSRLISIVLFLGIIFLLVIDPLNFKSDGSLLSKIEFFNSTSTAINKGSWLDIVFGYGASFKAITSVLNVQGWSPHVHVLKAFLYYGILGVIVFFGILISFIKEERKMFFPVLSYFIFGLAGAPIFWPTLSIGVIIMKIDKNIRDKNDF